MTDVFCQGDFTKKEGGSHGLASRNGGLVGFHWGFHGDLMVILGFHGDFVGFTHSLTVPFFFNGHDSGSDSLEVPTIYKA